MPTTRAGCQITKIVGSAISRGNYGQTWHWNIYDTLLFSKTLGCTLMIKLNHDVRARNWTSSLKFLISNWVERVCSWNQAFWKAWASYFSLDVCLFLWVELLWQMTHFIVHCSHGCLLLLLMQHRILTYPGGVVRSSEESVEALTWKIPAKFVNWSTWILCCYSVAEKCKIFHCQKEPKLIFDHPCGNSCSDFAIQLCNLRNCGIYGGLLLKLRGWLCG